MAAVFTRKVLWMLMALAVLSGTLAVGACNTVSGAGKDIEAAGDAIDDSAQRTKQRF